MGFDLKILKISPNLFAWQYTESIAARTDHYVDVFVHENVALVMSFWRRYDVRKFNADAILFWENQFKKDDF